MWNWRARGSEPMKEDAGVPEVQALLRDLESRRVEPDPYFAKRVMAAIEGREAEIVRGSRAWAAVPTFASRLSAIAALLLVMAGTWLYTGRHSSAGVQTGAYDDMVAATSAAQDEVFVIPSEEAR